MIMRITPLIRTQRLLVIGLTAVFLLLAACTTSPPPNPAATTVSQQLPSATATEIAPTETPPPPTATPKATTTATMPPTATVTNTQEPTATATTPPTATATPTTVSPTLFTKFANVDPAHANYRLWLAGSTPYLFGDGIVWGLSDAGWQPCLDSFEGELLGIDRLANVWVAKNDGTEITRWDGVQWHRYGNEAGWTAVIERGGQPVLQQKLIVDNNDQFWLYTGSDVRRFANEQWTVFTPDEMGLPLPETDERAATYRMAYEPVSDTIWVGNCEWDHNGPYTGWGVSVFNGRSWQPLRDQSRRGCVNDIVPAVNGDIWFNTGSTLWHYDAQFDSFDWIDAPEADFGGYGWVHHLAVDHAGGAWPIFVHCGGASCFGSQAQFHLPAEGGWQPIALEAEGNDPHILSTDGQGNLWFLYKGELFHRQNEEFVAVEALDTRRIVVGDDGQLWFVGSPAGREPGVWRLASEAQSGADEAPMTTVTGTIETTSLSIETELTNRLLPTEEELRPIFDGYNEAITAVMETASPADFTPNLELIDELVKSIQISDE